MTVVLDASALLAYLLQEPGAEVVDGLLGDARMAPGSTAFRLEIAPASSRDCGSA